MTVVSLAPLQAEKAPLDLVHLLQQTPDILSHVPHHSLTALLASSRALRSHVHEFVTSVKIQDQTDATLLVSTKWPALRSFRFCGDSIQPENMQHLCHNSWHLLTTLNLDDIRLDLPCILLLLQGNWPSLEHLAISNTDLDVEGMQAMQQGKWPNLRCLGISSSSINLAQLTAGPWKQLHSLFLRYKCRSVAENGHSVADNGQLCKQLPQLRELLICDVSCNTLEKYTGNVYPIIGAIPQHVGEPETVLVHRNSKANWSCMEVLHLYECSPATTNLDILDECQWPMMKSFLFGGLIVSDAGYARLSQQQWPTLKALEMLDIDLSSVGVDRIVSAKWPRLRKLSLSQSNLDTDSCCAQLASGQWPQLERLCLRGCELQFSGVKELVQGKWPLLKVLDLSYHNLTYPDEGLQHLLTSDWPKLECLELNCGAFPLRPCQYSWT